MAHCISAAAFSCAGGRVVAGWGEGDGDGMRAGYARNGLAGSSRALPIESGRVGRASMGYEYGQSREEQSRVRHEFVQDLDL